jgi:hypothetical protein
VEGKALWRGVDVLRRSVVHLRDSDRETVSCKSVAAVSG